MHFLYWIDRHTGIYRALCALLVLLVLLWVANQISRSIEADREIPLTDALATFSSTLESGTVNSRAMGAAILFGLENREAKQLVLGKLPPNAPQVLSALDTLRTLYFCDVAFILNQRGVVTAYSSQYNMRGTGIDLSFRPYAQLAMQGIPNVYPGIGTINTERGIFLAAPVRAEQNNTSKVIGAVVVRVGASKLDALLKTWAGGPAVLLSPQGLVFATSREDWLFHITGEVDQQRLDGIRRVRQFGKMFERAQPPSLPFTADMTETSIDGVRHIVRSHSLEWDDPEGDWKLILLDRRDPWWTHWSVLGAVTLAGLITVMALFWLYTLARNAVLQRENHRALEAAQQYLSELTDNTPVAVFQVLADENGRRFTKFISHRVKDIVGVEAEAIMAQREHLFDHVPAEDRAAYEAELDACIAKGSGWNTTFRVILNGDTCWIQSFAHALRAADGSIHYNGFIEDITARKTAEDQIRNLAFYDPLTLLPNRRLLDDRLVQTMAASKRDGRYSALMFLDLDKFKQLNDTYGHAMGDLLLVEVARRITSCVREVDTVARFGGDEFVVILSELDVDKTLSTAQADIVAKKILALLAEPYVLTLKHEGSSAITVEHHCSSSIGVVLFVDHSANPEEILKWADIAMYQAKSDGRNLIRFFDPKTAGN